MRGQCLGRTALDLHAWQQPTCMNECSLMQVSATERGHWVEKEDKT